MWAIHSWRSNGLDLCILLQLAQQYMESGKRLWRSIHSLRAVWEDFNLPGPHSSVPACSGGKRSGRRPRVLASSTQWFLLPWRLRRCPWGDNDSYKDIQQRAVEQGIIPPSKSRLASSITHFCDPQIEELERISTWRTWWCVPSTDGHGQCKSRFQVVGWQFLRIKFYTNSVIA